MSNNTIVAVGVAIINKNSEVLIAKRSSDKPMPDKWEFPGGKLEANETLEECGIREINEELELDIDIDVYLGYEDLKYDGKVFCLHLYAAHLKDEGQVPRLNEHSEAKWVAYSNFNEYDFPANSLSFIKELEKLL